MGGGAFGANSLARNLRENQFLVSSEDQRPSDQFGRRDLWERPVGGESSESVSARWLGAWLSGSTHDWVVCAFCCSSGAGGELSYESGPAAMVTGHAFQRG